MNEWTTEQKDQILEAVELAVIGMITDQELCHKLEKITGGKIENHEGVFGKEAA